MNGNRGDGRWWQYYRDESALDSSNNFIGFSANDSNSILFKFKQQITQITGQTGNGVTKNFEIMVPLTYLSNLWQTHFSIKLLCGWQTYNRP